MSGNMRFVPSPIPFRYNEVYTATANQSGRMQYHKMKQGQRKERISRTAFIDAFNNEQIIAMRPLPVHGSPVFELEFYI